MLGHFQVCKNFTFLQRGVFRVFPFLALAFFTRVSDANEICALWKSIVVLALCFIWSFGVIQINRALFWFANTNFSSFVSKCKCRDINLFWNICGLNGIWIVSIWTLHWFLRVIYFARINFSFFVSKCKFRDVHLFWNICGLNGIWTVSIWSLQWFLWVI